MGLEALKLEVRLSREVWNIDYITHRSLMKSIAPLKPSTAIQIYVLFADLQRRPSSKLAFCIASSVHCSHLVVYSLLFFVLTVVGLRESPPMSSPLVSTWASTLTSEFNGFFQCTVFTWKPPLHSLTLSHPRTFHHEDLNHLVELKCKVRLRTRLMTVLGLLRHAGTPISENLLNDPPTYSHLPISILN